MSRLSIKQAFYQQDLKSRLTYFFSRLTIILFFALINFGIIRSTTISPEHEYLYPIVNSYLPCIYLFYLLYHICFPSAFNFTRRWDDWTYPLMLIPGLILITNTYNPIWIKCIGLSYLSIILLKTGIGIYGILQIIPDRFKNRVHLHISIMLFLISFAYIFFIGKWMTSIHHTTGDEPYHLLIMHSMYHDHDINLHNNIENKDFAKFTNQWNFTQQTGDSISTGEYYSHHFPFFHLLYLPGYIMSGYPGVIFQQNILGAFLFLLIFLLVYEFAGSTKQAITAWILAFLTPPLVIYSSLVYREILAGVLICLLLWMILKSTHNELKIFIVFLFGIPLILLGERYAIVLIPSLIYCVLSIKNHSKSYKIIISYCFIIILSITLFFYIQSFRGITLSLLLKGELFHPLNLIYNLPALFIDQHYGLFWVAPVFILVIGGIPNAYSIRSGYTIFILSILLSYLLILACYIDAPGWAAPTPRYLVCILPLLLVFLGHFKISNPRSYLLFIFYTLFLLSFIIEILLFLAPSLQTNWFMPSSNPILYRFGDWLHLDLSRLFPSIYQSKTIFWIYYILFILFSLFMLFLCIKFKLISLLLIEQVKLRVSIILISIIGLISAGIIVILISIYVPVYVIESENTNIIVYKGGDIYPDPHKHPLQYKLMDRSVGHILYPNDILSSKVHTTQGLKTIRIWIKTLSEEFDSDISLDINQYFTNLLIAKSQNWAAYEIICPIDSNQISIDIKNPKSFLSKDSSHAVIIDKIEIENAKSWDRMKYMYSHPDKNSIEIHILNGMLFRSSKMAIPVRLSPGYYLATYRLRGEIGKNRYPLTSFETYSVITTDSWFHYITRNNGYQFIDSTSWINHQVIIELDMEPQILWIGFLNDYTNNKSDTDLNVFIDKVTILKFDSAFLNHDEFKNRLKSTRSIYLEKITNTTPSLSLSFTIQSSTFILLNLDKVSHQNATNEFLFKNVPYILFDLWNLNSTSTYSPDIKGIDNKYIPKYKYLEIINSDYFKYPTSFSTP